MYIYAIQHINMFVHIGKLLYLCTQLEDSNEPLNYKIMKKKFTLKVTSEEYNLLLDLILSARDCMSYDEFSGEYTDGGKFILCLDENEYKTLMNIKL